MNCSRIGFTGKGHPNILADHLNTLEFTRDKDLTLNGDCIVAVGCDFSGGSFDPMKEWMSFKATITAGGHSIELSAAVNKGFHITDEIVIRRSDFSSERTLGIRADKAAVDLDRKMVERLKNPETKVSVIFKKLK